MTHPGREPRAKEGNAASLGSPSVAGEPQGLLRRTAKALGPGLVTGASDDDPSGIGTYSQVGAQFGFGLAWTMLFSYPLMTAVQIVSARVGRTTGHGIAGNLRRHYPKWLTFSLVGLLVVANVINIGADIGAMAASAVLVLGGPHVVYVVGFGLVSIALQVFVPYTSYVRYLKWLTLSLFAYVATALVAHVPWKHAGVQTLVPPLSLKAAYLAGFIAVIGTTISPYLLFWQASQEVEEIEAHSKDAPLKDHPSQAPRQLARIRLDTATGMAFSNVIGFCIIVTTGATLHAEGIVDINTAADAARALEPLAGRFAFVLFSLGIVATGLLAVPVLAGSAAYGAGEALRLRVGLERRPTEARGFYGIIAAATGVGIVQNFFGLNPMKALFVSAVINGIVAVPAIAIMMLTASNRRVMGAERVGGVLRALGWTTAAVMLIATVGLVITALV